MKLAHSLILAGQELSSFFSSQCIERKLLDNTNKEICERSSHNFSLHWSFFDDKMHEQVVTSLICHCLNEFRDTVDSLGISEDTMKLLTMAKEYFFVSFYGCEHS